MKNKKRSTNQPIGYLLILPNYIIYFIFILLPIVWTISMSFTDYNLVRFQFVGLDNYKALLNDQVFIQSLQNTVVYSIMYIAPSMVLGLALALMLNSKIPVRSVFRTIFYMPNMLSMVAISMAWLYLYNTNTGVLNRLLTIAGFEPVPWLTNANYAMLSVVIMSIWNTMGYNMIIFLSGLQSIPEYLYEAASIDGATAVEKFIHITLPGLAPTTFFIFVMACISSFQVFGQVYVMTSGGPVNATTTLAHQIFKNGFEYYKMGYASSMALVLMVIIICITLVNFKFGKGEDGDLS